MVELRQYQKEAVRSVFNEFNDGVRSTLLVMSTGTGKTVCFTEIAKEFVQKQQNVLVLAHRSELIKQAWAAFDRHGMPANIEQADQTAAALFQSRVTIGSVQSMCQQKRLSKYPRDHYSLLITDEAHHSPGKSYRSIYNHFETAKHLGVTATPSRHDQIGLKNIFESVAFQYSIQDAIADGWLCQIKGHQVQVDDIHLENIRIVAGEFSQPELDAMLREEKALQGMVLPTLKYAESRPTIVFTTGVEHAHEIAACFNRTANQRVAVAVDGGMPSDARALALSEFESGKVQFLVNVGIATEGYDHPPTACIALFRPTRSLGLLAQMVGRGTRLFENKKDCIVLDFVGAHNTVRTVTVNDVLDGTILSDAEHLKAQELQADGMYATDAVQEAKRAIAYDESLKARFKAFTTSSAFDVAGLFALPSCKGKWGGVLATTKQRQLIEGKGIKCPSGMERAEASELIDKIIVRQHQGLATFKQMRMLKKAGYPVDGIEAVSFTDASKLIGEYMDGKKAAFATV